MIEKLLIIGACTAISCLCTAQVGIGLNGAMAQKALHVSGVSQQVPNGAAAGISLVRPTVRIEGLNNANQINNPSGNQGNIQALRPVSVSSNGDLVLSPLQVMPIIMYDPVTPGYSGTDYITTAVSFSSPTSGSEAGAVLTSLPFVLQFPSIVKLGATTSFIIRNGNNTATLLSGSNIIWGTRFRFASAPTGISTAANAFFGDALQGYANTSTAASAQGVFYCNSEDTLYLPAGNYILTVNAYIKANPSTVTPIVAGATMEVGTGIDTLSIVAYPVQ